MHDWVKLYVALAVACFALSALLTRLLITIAPRLGLIDQPAEHKHHRQPTPVAGGAAICIALLPLIFVPGLATAELLPILGGCLLLAMVGLLDDKWHVSAPVKFGILLTLTGVLWMMGISVTTTRVPVLDLAITILWIAGVSSAFNAIDNMDGLATGTTTIAAAAFLWVAVQTEQWTLGALSAALVGASVGFLVFNFPPARIFMGDTGSFSIGFVLASLGIIGEWNEREVVAAVIPILILGLPIFDLSFTVIRRHMLGVTRTPLEALRHCDTDHISHRLVSLGLSPRAAVMILYLLATSFALSAITLRKAQSLDGILQLLQAFVIVMAVIPVLCLADGRDRPRATWPRLRWGLGLVFALATALLFSR